jgi:hypothetical protein
MVESVVLTAASGSKRLRHAPRGRIIAANLEPSPLPEAEPSARTVARRLAREERAPAAMMLVVGGAGDHDESVVSARGRRQGVT